MSDRPASAGKQRRTKMREQIEVGGRLPGTVTWRNDSVAVVHCDGHDDPLAVYEAACHEGADLADLDFEQIGDDYLVGPTDALAMYESARYDVESDTITVGQETTTMTTIRIDARTYEDHDDCLSAAAADVAAERGLDGWDLNPRYEDEQRETILVDIPTAPA